MSDDELQTRVEYGRTFPDPVGWVPEYRGIEYAAQQRTVHFRIDEPVMIDHWTFADHRHPVVGCTFCADLAAEGKAPVTTAGYAESRLSAVPPKGE